jgi:hypothetical protein
MFQQEIDLLKVALVLYCYVCFLIEYSFLLHLNFSFVKSIIHLRQHILGIRFWADF